jgi:hypothetical protein
MQFVVGKDTLTRRLFGPIIEHGYRVIAYDRRGDGRRCGARPDYGRNVESETALNH